MFKSSNLVPFSFRSSSIIYINIQSFLLLKPYASHSHTHIKIYFFWDFNSRGGIEDSEDASLVVVDPQKL